MPRNQLEKAFVRQMAGSRRFGAARQVGLRMPFKQHEGDARAVEHVPDHQASGTSPDNCDWHAHRGRFFPGRASAGSAGGGDAALLR